MTAIVDGRKVELPRYTKKQLERGAAGLPMIVNETSKSRSLRYQNLPDFDPNESDEQIMTKLEERFLIMRDMTNECIEGRVRAMVASGPGGVGKTYAIDEELDKWDPEGEQYQSMSGYMSKTGVFRALWENREEGQLIKLDDMDAVFYDDTSLNLIKRATDTTQKRLITRAVEGVILDKDEMPIPRTFEYKGTMIFITNLDFDTMIEKGNKLTPHLEAIITRSHYIDLGMKTKRDYLVRVFQVAAEGNLFVGDNELDEEQQKDVLEFIDDHHRVLRECSLRMALKIASLRKSWSETDRVSWQRKALLTCCRGMM